MTWLDMWRSGTFPGKQQVSECTTDRRSQTWTIEQLSAPHQTVLEMFLGYRKLLYSCTERMCHSSTRPVIALGQCSASNHSIILHSKLPAQGNAWWWKIVQLTQACDMMQRRTSPGCMYMYQACDNAEKSLSSVTFTHTHMHTHTHAYAHTHTLVCMYTLPHRWVNHRLHLEYQKQEQMLLLHSNHLCCLLRMSHSTSDSHLPECLEQMKCKKVRQQQSSIKIVASLWL